MTATRVTRAGWYALALVSLTNAVSLLDRNILAILAQRIKHGIGVGDAEMGLLYGTVFALFYALFSLPMGRLADGWVRTRLLAIALAFWSMATALAAVAHGFSLLAISRLGVGIGESAAIPAGISLVYDHFPRQRRGFAMAVIAAAIALGLGGSSVLGGLAADWWDSRVAGTSALLAGWQFAFLVAALPGMVLAVLVWFMPEPERGAIDGIPTPRDPAPGRASLALFAAILPVSNWLMLAARRAGLRVWLINLAAYAVVIVAMALLIHLTSGFSPRPPLSLGGWQVNPHLLQWGVVGFGLIVVVNLMQNLQVSDPPTFNVITRSPSLLLCFAIGALQTTINYGIMGFTPSFLLRTYHMTPATAGLQFGLLSAALGIVGPLLAGPLSDRMNVRFPGAGRAWVTLGALGFSPLIALWVYHAPDPAHFYLRFIAYSLVLTAWLPPLYAVLYDLVLPRMRGIASSTYIINQNIFGLGIGPFVVGMVSDANGGNLGAAILSINWVSPAIVVMLVILAMRAHRDEQQVLARARAGGEAV